MVTWGEMENFTWDELGLFTHDELEHLSLEQIRRHVEEFWPVLAKLSPADRAAFHAGLLDQTLPPALLAAGDTEYTPVQKAALKLWGRAPLSRSEFVAWLSLMVSVVQTMQTQFKDEPVPPSPPPAIELHLELPEGVRPLPQTPEAPESPVRLLPNNPVDMGPVDVPPTGTRLEGQAAASEGK